MRKHRATGNPRGRPRVLPSNLRELILESLKRRQDPETGLVKPGWKGMARELGVSCSTIARQMAGLRQCGAVESVIIQTSPESVDTFYRLHDLSRHF